MLTSFFRKSKPANFLIVTLAGLFFYLLYNFTDLANKFDVGFVTGKLGGFIVLGLLFFFINFILFKDKSEGRHAYVLLFIFIFSVSIPAIFRNPTVILAGFFVVLGLRKTILMQTGKELNRKIFDSFFFFSLATLFVPSTIFFMLVPIWGIFYYTAEDYRSWFIPIPALLSVWILKTSLDLLLKDRFFNIANHYHFSYIEFTAYSPIILGLSGILLLFSVWTLTMVLRAASQIAQREKRANFLLIVTTITALLSILFSGKIAPHPQEVWLFLFIPLALINGKFYDLTEPTKRNEIILITLCVLCIAVGIILNFKLI